METIGNLQPPNFHAIGHQGLCDYAEKEAIAEAKDAELPQQLLAVLGFTGH